jgi:hypothetical protein
MASLLPSNRNSHWLLQVSVFLAMAAALLIGGCKPSNKVDDPQLKPIQDMIDQNLPTGSPQGTVIQFLSMRGYPTEPSEKPGTLVAIIRHIDTVRLQPVTARVTFYFDANGKLNTYEIVRTMNAPVPQ